MKHTDNSGKVLQFSRSGDFFYRVGVSKLESNDMAEAMAYYRQALKLEPNNAEYKLATAELLTETGRYEESNCILFNGFSEAERPPEAFFGMGCNFLNLRDLDYALDSFNRYLDAAPDGEYADDALDMVAAFDELPEKNALYSASTLEAVRLTTVGHELIARGDMKSAVDALEAAVRADGRWYPAQNYLALAYFCERKHVKAAECVAAVLKAEPSNLQANCNSVIIANAAKDLDGVNRGLEALSRLEPADAEDIGRIALVYMELSRYAEARTLLLRAVQQRPYDTDVNHRLAVCAYELGDYKSAMLCYDKLCKLDDKDSVARYYFNLCRHAASRNKRAGGIRHEYQVPYSEMLSRVKRAWAVIRMTPEEQRALWNEDSELELLVRWGFKLPQQELKIGLLIILSNIGGADVERLLRDLALERTQPNEFKEHIVKVLYTIGASEPYIAYTDGRLVESRVSVVDASAAGELPRSYRMVLPLCANMLKSAKADGCIQRASELWARYTEALSKPSPLSRPRIVAFAAALEFLARDNTEAALSEEEICVVYGITRVRFGNAYKQMTEVLGSLE